MLNIIDITLPISPALPVWEGDPPIMLERVADMNAGAPCNISRLDCGVHTGTHIDAPLHFVANGTSVEQLDLDRFVGKCHVIELTGDGRITASELESAMIPADCHRLLLKTTNSALWLKRPLTFEHEFRALDHTAAQWCVDRGVKLIGVDYLSVESYHADVGNPTHKILLQAEIGIIEGLNLNDVVSGEYRLVCLPLKLVGSDGAPARVILELL